MSTIAQFQLVTPSPPRTVATPENPVINLTVESDEKLLLTVVEAARRLGIGRSLMYELIGSGQIESIHVGRLHKVPIGALTAFVERLTRTPSGG